MRDAKRAPTANAFSMRLIPSILDGDYRKRFQSEIDGVQHVVTVMGEGAKLERARTKCCLGRGKWKGRAHAIRAAFAKGHGERKRGREAPHFLGWPAEMLWTQSLNPMASRL